MNKRSEATVVIRMLLSRFFSYRTENPQLESRFSQAFVKVISMLMSLLQTLHNISLELYIWVCFAFLLTPTGTTLAELWNRLNHYPRMSMSLYLKWVGTKLNQNTAERGLYALSLWRTAQAYRNEKTINFKLAISPWAWTLKLWFDILPIQSLPHNHPLGPLF